MLVEPAWKTAASTGPLVDVAHGRAESGVPVNAEVKLLWNDTGMYVAFSVADTDLIGGFKKGDQDPHLWTKDTVEMMIDPDGDGDNKDYYEIQINPQNLVFDSQFDAYNEPKVEPMAPSVIKTGRRTRRAPSAWTARSTRAPTKIAVTRSKLSCPGSHSPKPPSCRPKSARLGASTSTP